MNKKTRGDYAPAPKDFPLRDTYVEKWIRSGGKRECSYPQNGLPKTKIKEGRVESSAVDAFGLRSP